MAFCLLFQEGPWFDAFEGFLRLDSSNTNEQSLMTATTFSQIENLAIDIGACIGRSWLH